MPKGIILLVCEGREREPQIIANLKANFPLEHEIIVSIFGAEIYQLWKKISEDTYLDLLELLRETRNFDSCNDCLAGIARDDISQIFLFFDHDGHSHPEMSSGINGQPDQYDLLVRKMLSTFNNETELGKLYLSYPMVEALADCKKDPSCCFECENFIRGNILYKENVAKRSDFSRFRDYQRCDWEYLFGVTMMKAFCIYRDEYKIPTYKEIITIDQLELYSKHYEFFILPKQTVVSISSFPFLLLDLNNEEFFNSIINSGLFVKNCCFFCILPHNQYITT